MNSGRGRVMKAWRAFLAVAAIAILWWVLDHSIGWSLGWAPHEWSASIFLFAFSAAYAVQDFA